MILEKNRQLRLKDIPPACTQADGISPDFFKDMIRIDHLYRSAMKEAAARLEILDSEFASMNDHSPIHHIECRVKSLNSLIGKMKRRGLPITADHVYKIQDIAGIRVICNYVDDIYYLRKLLIGTDGFPLIRESDYIRTPKPNGYRSLHLILNVPFVISYGEVKLPVEIQMRTIAMDMWASLEHELRYKSDRIITEKDSQTLNRCSSMLAEIDQTMQALFHKSDTDSSVI